MGQIFGRFCTSNQVVSMEDRLNQMDSEEKIDGLQAHLKRLISAAEHARMRICMDRCEWASHSHSEYCSGLNSEILIAVECLKKYSPEDGD